MELSDGRCSSRPASRGPAGREFRAARSGPESDDVRRRGHAADTVTRAEFVGRARQRLRHPRRPSAVCSSTSASRTVAGTPGRQADRRLLLQEINELFETFRIDQRARDDREIAAAVERRRQLRTNRRFAEADAIRTDLATRGITLEDTPDGTRWWPQDK